MKIAITDACLFIDIIELDLAGCFFDLPIEIHTSLDVFNELYTRQQAVLTTYIDLHKLFIHSLSENEVLEIRNIPFPRALSEVDKTVIYLAKKLDAVVLSSDKLVRNYSKSCAIDYHGMLWVFDQLVETNLVVPEKAADKLRALITTNIIYQNNESLVEEIFSRINTWMKK